MRIKKGGLLAFLVLATVLAVALAAVPAATVSADGASVSFKYNFGGTSDDEFFGVTAALDGGFVAVGYSHSDSFDSTGDWPAGDGKGDRDAIIVKYDENGIVEWKKNFGGSDDDEFYGVTAALDGGFVAVGYSRGFSFDGTGDWPAGSGEGSQDAIIVKYDENGNVEWMKNFGGAGHDEFYGVTAALDGGFAAVGYSDNTSFGTGDWPAGIEKGSQDAIIVKFDENGGVEWQKNFGGKNDEWYYGVTATSDGGFAAVGYSDSGSFDGAGDWPAGTSNGAYDAIIVKYDENGGVEWMRNFGGASFDYFYSVTATLDDGFVAAGSSYSPSFGTGDWTGVTTKGAGSYDAIIVKYDENGGVEWKKNFGGADYDEFDSVTATTNGCFVAAGYSSSGSFNGAEDWPAGSGKGDDDAIIVKYDEDGNVLWRENFGGNNLNYFKSVTALSDGCFVAVGNSYENSFGTVDWTGVSGKGGKDAIVVRYDEGIVPVTNITGVPSSATAGTPLVLTGTVVPASATNDTIVWSVNNAGTTGATIAGNTLSTTGAGTVIVTATIANGTANGAYTKDFSITVNASFIPVTNITGIPTSATAGTSLVLNGTVAPANATNKAITWSVNNAGTTGATITGNTLLTTGAGTVIVTATIANGTANGAYTKDFTINVTAAPVNTFVPVTDVALASSSMTAGTPMNLSGTVTPADATNKSIVWSVTDSGGTGASISGSTLSASDSGTVVVTATVTDGKTAGTPYTKNFTITVNSPNIDDGTGTDDSSDNGSSSDLLLRVVVGLVVAFLVVAAIVLFKNGKISG